MATTTTTLSSLLSHSSSSDVASSSSSTAVTVTTMTSTVGVVNDVVDDSFDDACTICLDPFSSHNPSTVTGCNHEYHLQCILEWSQRSRDCPICSQLLVLKDPASQELLAAVETERLVRSRNTISARSSNVPQYSGGAEQDSYSDDSDLEERIMQHIALAASRARNIRRRETQRDAGDGPSQVLFFSSPQNVSSNHQTCILPVGHSSPASAGANSTTSGSAIDLRNVTSGGDNQDSPFKSRLFFRQPTNDTPEGPDSPEISISDTIKSKWLLASARCKESMTKGARGIKEKLLVHNTSVRELSKGVQREFNAGVASVARMIERLDLNSTRSGSSSPVSSVTSEASTFSFRGKGIEDNDIAHPHEMKNGNVHEMRNQTAACDIFQGGH